MAQALFSAASLAALLAWLGLAWAGLRPPGAARVWPLALCGRGVPLALCVLYLAVGLWHHEAVPGAGFGSLSGVLLLFAAPGRMLGAWLHFLAFDLLVGRWIVDDVLAGGRHRALLVTLPLACWRGPLGLLAYLGLRRLGGAALSPR